ncbi:MAG UNVERIFIED_CONTAM: hypothetical protein LVR29_15810 [Microcystis novacekii LVE1205-3]|jgi:hypothetical protein
MPLPLGWNEKGWFNGEQIKEQNGWLQAIFGWLMTGVAVAMGAPFWFDILGKLDSTCVIRVNPYYLILRNK